MLFRSVVVGKNAGVVCDKDGKYAITVGENDSLQFTFLGKRNETIYVGKKTAIHVCMPDEIETGTNAIRFRDSNGSDIPNPLVIIDGEELSMRTMNHIDPNEIESISVLRDASTVAIYGDKAKNGVVIITTKKDATKGIMYDKDSSIPDYKTRQGTTYTPEGYSNPTTLISDDLRLDIFNAPFNLSDVESVKAQKNGVTIITTRNKNHPLYGQKWPLVTAENSPLYFVDGIKVNSIEKISPESIESIEILKDQSATAFYGEDAKNGVILINKKKKN